MNNASAQRQLNKKTGNDTTIIGCRCYESAYSAGADVWLVVRKEVLGHFVCFVLCT